MAYVVEGQAVLNVAGRPPRTLTSGDGFAVPPMAVRGIHNVGNGPLTLVSTYVVEVGKPILRLSRTLDAALRAAIARIIDPG